ncbi:MAG: nucleoside phosphorylase [Prevotellaceae bacterium]|jgi:uridine phosphorylase|nr:nucleoside phosphorylase [Prevotellaceae bacterium]
MRTIEASELMINSDGSIFHLHLKPEDIADTVILVGDPARVNLVTSYFDDVELETNNREFVSKTGRYKGKRFTVLSTGIGTDNIDIVLNELDALANIDFTSRTVKPQVKSLNLIRMGTSGALQPDIPVGSTVMSDISIGFDGLLNFYANRNKVSELDIEDAFIKHMNWNAQLPNPYFVAASNKFSKLIGNEVIHGMTISAPGFYAPQGRVLRLPLQDADLLAKIESFRFNGKCITNFEMESSAIAGLALLMGHHATTICTIIANRYVKAANTDYKNAVENMIKMGLDKLIQL